MMDLSDIRREIDAVDEQLCALLDRRTALSEQVAIYKAANNIPVLNAVREQEVMDKAAARCHPDNAGTARLVLGTIMDASRALQHRRLQSGKALRDQLANAKTELRKAPRVICQGCAGAYSHQAATRLFADGTPTFVKTFEQVFTAVENGQADYGVLPIENSFGGSVQDVYDLLLEHRFSIVAAVELPVEHCLVACPGTAIHQVQTVYSKEQALEQCDRFLADHDWELHPYANTALAAKMVAERQDPTIAAVASRQAAELYGLQVLAENIQTNDHNVTRFIAIANELVITPDANRVSVMFTQPHTAGSLYRMLGQFFRVGMNLTKIESRPLRSQNFQYVFYLDFESTPHRPDTRELLCALSEETEVFTLLGGYKES